METKEDTKVEVSLYVLGITRDSTESDLFSLFESFGEVVSVKILKDSSGQSKKSAIVNLKTPSPSSVLTLDRTLLNGKKIRVRVSEKKRKSLNTESSIVYVGNLPFSSTEDEIGAVFEQFGRIKEIRIVKDLNKKSKGLCYVEFEDEKDAEKALEMNEAEFKGKGLRVDIAEMRKKIKKDITRPYYWALEDS